MLKMSWIMRFRVKELHPLDCCLYILENLFQVKLEQGLKMLKIFKDHDSETSDINLG